MTPLERAALALAQYDDAHGDEPDDCPYRTIEDLRRFSVDYQRYISRVRAVLTAIREPSEAMMGDRVVRAAGYAGDLDEVWRYMIDAALEEG